MTTEAEKIIKSVYNKLPAMIYDDSDYHFAWSNEYQRQSVARQLAIYTIEQKLRVLENIRGDGLAFHTGWNTIPIDMAVEYYTNLIKEIKEII